MDYELFERVVLFVIFSACAVWALLYVRRAMGLDGTSSGCTSCGSSKSCSAVPPEPGHGASAADAEGPGAAAPASRPPHHAAPGAAPDPQTQGSPLTFYPPEKVRGVVVTKKQKVGSAGVEGR